MRGIPWNDIVRVRLVKPTHPEVLAYQRRLVYLSTLDLDAKFREREQERELLSTLLGEPFERLTTQEEMLEAFMAHVYQPPPLPTLPPATCLDCRHCSGDRYHAGGFVCWQGWTPGGRPKVLQALGPCADFQDKRPPPAHPSPWQIRQDMADYLALHGIQYNGSRWKGHRNDLEREAGTWGFQAGRQWEQDVRTWLVGRYGDAFLSPYRWLIIDTRAGAHLFRELDGLERVGDQQAFVYEIKHHTSAYVKLTKEYLPLLQRAYPTRMFTPIEINIGDPYGGLVARTALPIRRLLSLEERRIDGGYQLLVLPEIPEDDTRVDPHFDPGGLVVYLQQMCCTECGGERWGSAEEMQEYLALTQENNIPQDPIDVCTVVDQIHPYGGACLACAVLLGLA
jgi:hypothetical protein